MSPHASSDLPGAGAGHARTTRKGAISPLIWSCSGWGLPCHPSYLGRGALLPHLFTLTCLSPVCLALGKKRAVYFLWHFPWTRVPQALPGTLPCGARTFLRTGTEPLSSPTRPARYGDCPASSRADSVGIRRKKIYLFRCPASGIRKNNGLKHPTENNRWTRICFLFFMYALHAAIPIRYWFAIDIDSEPWKKHEWAYLLVGGEVYRNRPKNWRSLVGWNRRAGRTFG
ncbi:MAG: hypothetical protein BECKG1743D_GA0114223_113031 [Candidatus Kentron sp. G]|nr:MAG: hypothetical protein BECKG1743E_GA0114224_111861 [Candidatus Kentron sp. G]VFN08131.1 MAG: hypothetical protein BECKG1743D_GA0114223_113031 [Candidatus Kentron sp. G]